MQRYLPTLLLLVLALNTGWFVVYSGDLGLRGLLSKAPGEVSRVFQIDGVLANAGLALHMIAGAVLTQLALRTIASESPRSAAIMPAE